jgi:predicted PurR-regulated permease PerM
MIVNRRITLIFLILASLFALWLCYILFRPFLYPILTAFVIAIVFFPAHHQIHRVIKSPSLAALTSTVLVMLVIILPAAMIIAGIINEVSDLAEVIKEESSNKGGLIPYFNSLLEQGMRWLRRYVNVSQASLREMMAARLSEFRDMLIAQSGGIVGGIASWIVDATIAIFTLFFLFREGKSLRRRIAALLPLSPDQIDKLFTGIENTIIGTVYGGLVVAAVQGALIGLALWFFGIPSPVLWGVVAAFFALIPLVGTAAVWVPAAIYLLASGHYVQAIILVAWGAGIVGTMDNILRPMLISGRVQMHTLLIFFAVFGGVSVFGFLGLFIGPVILAVTMTLLNLLRDEARQWPTLWREEPAPEPAGAPVAGQELATGRTEDEPGLIEPPKPRT